MVADAAHIPVIEVRSVSKQFAAVRALDGISLVLETGEVHGIIGENGAGKSTLMKILSGVEHPTTGSVHMRGRPVELRGPLDAQRLGIAMIHQELNLVDELSVADNIFLGRELSTIGGWVRGRSTYQQAEQALRNIDCDVHPETKVKHLSIAQKQMVEIAKAVSTNASVLIMDEPTAVLTVREVKALFSLIARLKSQDKAIVYISHILPEVVALCDRVTVMRDGRLVTTIDRQKVHSAGEKGLASLMVGRPMAEHFPPRHEHAPEVALDVANLSVPGLLRNVSFQVRKGEILGLAGLIGAGRTETAETLVGLRPKSSGVITVDGKIVTINNPRDAVRTGIAYLSEDRKAAGLTLPMSIVANTTMVSLRRYTRLLIRRRLEERRTQEHVQRLRIKVGHITDPVSTLSGGNQQKVLLAKWLEINPRVLIVDEPTRGVDIGAKEEIYRLIQELTVAGMACVMISSEMNELIGMCHRIGVMRKGQLVATIDGRAATEEQIMYHAAGVTDAGVHPR